MKISKKGFTLIELIVVLAILAVIAAIAVPTAFGAITDAQIAADTASIESFNSAIRMQAALLRANKDAAAHKDNDFLVALLNAQVKMDGKPQSNGEIGLEWIVPTDNTIGHFEVKDDGTNVVSNDDWLSILGKAAGKNVV
ncbi:MAG: prepilin-type N-terminal cleavage/methylation domain-containing protein, partial [Oscillospiraceae bacterium]